MNAIGDPVTDTSIMIDDSVSKCYHISSREGTSKEKYNINRRRHKFCRNIRHAENLPHRLIISTPFTAKSTISYGLIVYAKNTKRWAIIRRKHSVEFLLYIKGSYRLTHLPFLLPKITCQEANIIKECILKGPNKFKEVYVKELGLDPDGLEYALIRLAETRNIVYDMLNNINLENNCLT